MLQTGEFIEEFGWSKNGAIQPRIDHMKIEKDQKTKVVHFSMSEETRAQLRELLLKYIEVKEREGLTDSSEPEYENRAIKKARQQNKNYVKGS